MVSVFCLSRKVTTNPKHCQSVGVLRQTGEVTRSEGGRCPSTGWRGPPGTSFHPPACRLSVGAGTSVQRSLVAAADHPGELPSESQWTLSLCCSGWGMDPRPEACHPVHGALPTACHPVHGALPAACHPIRGALPVARQPVTLSVGPFPQLGLGKGHLKAFSFHMLEASFSEKFSKSYYC